MAPIVNGARGQRSLTVLQHNVLAWTKKRKFNLANQYLAHGPDVILLNSHGNKEKDRIKIFPYRFYQQNRSQQRSDGVAIGVRHGIAHTITRDFSSEVMAVTIDTAHGKLTIATAYLPPRRDYLPVNDFLRLATTPHPTYILGDLNPHHRVFGYQAPENNVGRSLVDMINRGLWTHLGPNFKTYHAWNASTTPDLVLANQRAHWNTVIEPGPSGLSDHIPILFKISADPLISRTPPRYHYKSANWERFGEVVAAGLDPPNLDGQPTAAIDAAIETFYNAMEAAKEAAIPKRTFKVNHHPRRSPLLVRLERDLCSLHEEAERTFWDRDKYATMKRLHRDMIAEGTRLKGIEWGELLTKIVQVRNEPKQFWAAVKRLRGTDVATADHLTDTSGPRPVKISDPAGKEEFMRRCWEPTFRISAEENRAFNPAYEARVEEELAARVADYSPFDVVDLGRLDEDDPASCPITPDDIKRVIKSFKNGKAPGPSGVKKDDLIHLPRQGLLYLAEVFSAALSAGYFPHRFKHARLIFIPKSGKNPQNPLHYRPISLLETPGKVFEKIINERVVEYTEANNVQDPQQYGFRPGRGTSKAIALAYETVANAVALGNGNATIVLRDIAKAFDKVWHPGLKHRLLEAGIPNLLCRTASHFLDGRTAAIRMDGVEGPAFPLVTGVPQGSCLSPTLFITYTADTPPPDPRTRSTHFAYADDHTGVVTFPFRFPQGTARNTQRATERRNRYEYDRKIKNEADKMRFITARRKFPAPLTIDGQNMPYAQSGIMLGLRMTNHGIHSQVVYLKGKGQRHLTKLRRFSNLPEATRLYLFKAIIRPILEYPAVVLCATSRSAQLELQRVQSNALLWVHGRSPDHRRPTNAFLHERYKVLPLNQRLHELARRVWERLDEDEDPNLQNIIAGSAHLQDGEEHSWWPRCRPRALGPPPPPLLLDADIVP